MCMYRIDTKNGGFTPDKSRGPLLLTRIEVSQQYT